MTAFSTIYRCISHPPLAVWKTLSSSSVVVPLSMINGRKINEENKVFRNNTGITAFPFSACFFKES